MARHPTCRSRCRNSPLTGKDKLAGAAPTEGSGTLTATPIVTRATTLALATAPAVTSSLDNKLFKQFMNAYLEAQVPSQTEVDPETRKQSLKAQLPDLYNRNLHIDFYRFC